MEDAGLCPGPAGHEAIYSEDILRLVFVHLPAEQILSVVSLVCTQWSRVARLDSLWKELLAKATGLREGFDPVIVPPPRYRRSEPALNSSGDTLSCDGTGGSAGSPLTPKLAGLSLETTCTASRGKGLERNMSWFRFALESRLARVLLGLSRCASAESPAKGFPLVTRQRDPLLWSLYPARLAFQGIFEQWQCSALLDIEPNAALPMNAALIAATNLLSANPAYPTIQPPEVHVYRGDLLVKSFEGRHFDGFVVYPSSNRRDAQPSITRVEGVISKDGRVRYRELEIIRNRGPNPILIPTGGWVSYDSHPGGDGPDQQIAFTVDLAPILTSPSSIPLELPFGERFGVAWSVEWAESIEGGRTEYSLAM